MDRLILVKHTMPEIDTRLSPHQWELGEAGRAGATRLASLLTPYSPDRMTTSCESKAAETGRIVARVLGIPLEGRAGLHEHGRSNVRFMGTEEFSLLVERFFNHPDDLVFGTETANEAAGRFGTAVAALLDDYPGGSIAITAHGTVISLFVAERTGIDPFTLWTRLGLPSFVVLSRPDYRLVDVVERV